MEWNRNRAYFAIKIGGYRLNSSKVTVFFYIQDGIRRPLGFCEKVKCDNTI